MEVIGDSREPGDLRPGYSGQIISGIIIPTLTCTVNAYQEIGSNSGNNVCVLGLWSNIWCIRIYNNHLLFLYREVYSINNINE